jgi:hypothetical protein
MLEVISMIPFIEEEIVNVEKLDTQQKFRLQPSSLALASESGAGVICST